MPSCKSAKVSPDESQAKQVQVLAPQTTSKMSSGVRREIARKHKTNPESGGSKRSTSLPRQSKMFTILLMPTVATNLLDGCQATRIGPFPWWSQVSVNSRSCHNKKGGSPQRMWISQHKQRLSDHGERSWTSRKSQERKAKDKAAWLVPIAIRLPRTPSLASAWRKRWLEPAEMKGVDFRARVSAGLSLALESCTKCSLNCLWLCFFAFCPVPRPHVGRQ